MVGVKRLASRAPRSARTRRRSTAHRAIELPQAKPAPSCSRLLCFTVENQRIFCYKARGFVVVGVKRLELPTSCSQSKRATNCATPRFILIQNTHTIKLLLAARCASLKNIVALLAWSASHCSLFFHLNVAPSSAAGSGAPFRPTALHPDLS